MAGAFAMQKPGLPGICRLIPRVGDMMYKLEEGGEPGGFGGGGGSSSQQSSEASSTQESLQFNSLQAASLTALAHSTDFFPEQLHPVL